MDYLDKLIPLVILGAVGAFLVFLVRRVARDMDAPPRAAETVAPAEVKPAPIEIAAIVETPAVVVPEAVPVMAEPMVAGLPPVIQAPAPVRRRKKPMATVATVIPTETPIQAVLGLLQEKDGLAVAFVLREIFAPPVSKRK